MGKYYNDREKIYDAALSAFGEAIQLVVAIEELGEAQKEVCKLLRGSGDLSHLAEEIADATIVLEQLQRIFGVEVEVNEFMERKLARLVCRIEEHTEADDDS